MKKIAPIVAIALGAMFTSCAKKNVCVCKAADGTEAFRADLSSVPSTKKTVCAAYNTTYSASGGSCKLQ